MGQRGPAPKPTALKLRAGNPGHRPLNLKEPVPAAGTPDRPDWVQGVAAAIWDQVVPRLATAGLARSIDGQALGRYCCLFEEWLRAKDQIKLSTTYPLKDENDRVIAVRELPQAGAMRKLSALLLQIEREFGLTPASRTRIHVENDKTVAKDTDELRRRFFATGG